jgi:dihydrofolate synthase/folylpolyglutamate synthase
MVLGSLDENRWLLGLARVRAALDRLGHPERQYKQILVGGTNGKGSTCIYLERILLAKGLKVGTTLSPHVRRYLERFRIDGHDVCEEEHDEGRTYGG